MAVEKELNRESNAFRFVKVTYDESSNFLIYPTPIGITVCAACGCVSQILPVF